MDSVDRVAYLVTYSGMVQGVGFRYIAQVLARGFPVVGWVRNLPDGRVRLLAEGAEADVRAFLDSIRGHWGDSIDNEDRERQPATGAYHGFEIAR
ncbi:MAG: acylphosphatase [Gemmataceae bacterium]